MKPAAVYCRISQDTEGLALGVARQREDCEALAEREGLDVAEVFTDNDIGASTRSRRKSRPAFDAMLERARAGEFAAIIAYSNSRLTRRPMEFEALIGLHQTTGTRITTVVSGEDDLATADGRMVARIKANVDAAEAERTGERIARLHLANARTGKPVGGTRPFGWQADKLTLDPAEARLIRRAAADIISGVPVRAVVRGWREAGVTSSRGVPWSHNTVRQLLRSPRLAGWRIHQGRIALDADGMPVRGQWEPILDQGTHDRLTAVLSRPEGRTRVPRRGARHYLLTGLVRCGVCNAPMFGNRYNDRGHFHYRCTENGHLVSVSGVGTDEVITELVLARLADVGVTPAPVEFAGEARLTEITEQVRNLMGAFVERRLSESVVFPAVEKLEAEQAQLRKARTTWQAETARPDVTHVDRDVWEGLDTDRRRAVTETVLDAVLIRPSTRKTGRRLDLERIVPVWRGVAR